MCNLSKGVYEKGIEKGLEKGIEKGIEKGFTARGVSDLRNIMETLNLTAEQAMEALRIPDSEKQTYRALLKKH